MKQALRYANNEKLLNYPDWKERVHKACIRACEGDQTRTGIIMLYLSRWSSPLMSSQLRNLCQSFARSSYSLLRGCHFEPCPRPADNAIIGLTDRFIPCGGIIASDQTPHLFGWLFWECGRIRTCNRCNRFHTMSKRGLLWALFPGLSHSCRTRAALYLQINELGSHP